LWETKVLHVITLITIYSVQTFRCLTAPMLYAVSRFDPKGCDSAKSSSSGSESDISVSNASLRSAGLRRRTPRRGHGRRHRKFGFCPKAQIQKANSGYLLTEFAEQIIWHINSPFRARWGGFWQMAMADLVILLS
jgi:hypothetical protein